MIFSKTNKLLFIHSITTKYNFINIVKNDEASLPKFLTNQNSWGCACTPFTPNSYTNFHPCERSS